MPVRVGIDLVRVHTIQESLDAAGTRYVERIFTPGEVEDCRSPLGLDALRLAARFAAKEAAMKALRVGDQAVPWTAIEVVRHADGHPELVLHGRAAELAAAAGVTDLQVSLTHEQDYASAVVVADIRAPTGQVAGSEHR